MAYTILRTSDVAAWLGLSHERVRQLEREGKLIAEKLPNGQRIFRAVDVERLAQERLNAKQGRQEAKAINF